MTDSSTQIADLVAGVKRAYAIGLQTGSGGNASLRIGTTESMWIKSSGCSFGACEKKNIVRIDFQGRVLEGEQVPSREYLTHVAVYKRRPDVQAVMHCHAPWSIAAAEVFDQLPEVTHHMKLKLGSVPILHLDAHADEQMSAETENLLSAHPHINAFIHRKHGIFSFGESVTEAEHQAELVEECAKIALLIRMIR